MDRDIEEIKKRLRIEEIISEYVKLKKTGSSYVGLCPFHNEKTPSFNVSADRGFYKCFGCGEGGDVLSFVQKFENLDFIETKKKLAEKAGVILQNFVQKDPKILKQKEENEKEEKRLLELLEEATKFFQINLLKNNAAKNYLKKRGVDEKTAKKFRLGFALDEWNSLESFLISRNFTKQDILKVGLTKENEKGSVYDRFRNRIIFPIFNEKGNPIAYSGRDFSDSDKAAKYLNSPQTVFFDKSEILFGMNFARVEGRKRKYFILVEGQMDLLMNHKIGFENSVATSGTSLTERHLKNISRFSKNLIFAFDADKAGLEASFKGIKKALALDFDVKILDIPNNSDPADIILKSEKEWIKIVRNSKNIIEFYIKKIIQSDKNLKEKIFEMEEKILPFVLEIQNPIEKGKYISRISKGFDIEQDYIVKALENTKSQSILEQEKENKRQKVIGNGLDIFSKNTIIEKGIGVSLKELSALYFWQKNLSKLEPLIDSDIILKILKENSEEDVLEKILNLDNEYIQNLIFNVERKYSEKDEHSLRSDIEEHKIRLEKINLEKKILAMKKKIDFCNEEQKFELLEKLQNLNNKKNDCKK